MIPDIAIIISTYAIARLVSEYLIPDNHYQLRGLVAVVASFIIVVFMIEVVSAGSSIGDLGI